LFFSFLVDGELRIESQQDPSNEWLGKLNRSVLSFCVSQLSMSLFSKTAHSPSNNSQQVERQKSTQSPATKRHKSNTTSSVCLISFRFYFGFYFYYYVNFLKQH
jgi:hypothetical protein